MTDSVMLTERALRAVVSSLPVHRPGPLWARLFARAFLAAQDRDALEDFAVDAVLAAHGMPKDAGVRPMYRFEARAVIDALLGDA